MGYALHPVARGPSNVAQRPTHVGDQCVVIPSHPTGDGSLTWAHRAFNVLQHASPEAAPFLLTTTPCGRVMGFRSHPSLHHAHRAHRATECVDRVSFRASCGDDPKLKRSTRAFPRSKRATKSTMLVVLPLSSQIAGWGLLGSRRKQTREVHSKIPISLAKKQKRRPVWPTNLKLMCHFTSRPRQLRRQARNAARNRICRMSIAIRGRQS